MKQRFQHETLSFEFSLAKVMILKPFTTVGKKFTMIFVDEVILIACYDHSYYYIVRVILH